MAISLLPSSVRDYMAVHISLNPLQLYTLHGNYAFILTLCFMSLSVKHQRIPHCYSGDGKIHTCCRIFLSYMMYWTNLLFWNNNELPQHHSWLFLGVIYCSVQREASRRNGCMRRGTFQLPSSMLGLCKLPCYSISTCSLEGSCIFQVSPWPVGSAWPRPWNNGGSSSKIHWSSGHEKRGKFLQIRDYYVRGISLDFLRCTFCLVEQIVCMLSFCEDHLTSETRWKHTRPSEKLFNTQFPFYWYFTNFNEKINI